MGTFLGGVMLDRRTYRSRAVAGVTLVAVDVATDEVLPTLSLVDQASPSPVTTNGDGAYSDFYIADRDIARLTAGGVSQVVVSAEVLQGQARSLAQTVPTAAELPAVERDGSLRITQDDLHLWVWEDSVADWTDLGPIQGEKGDKGDPGGVGLVESSKPGLFVESDAVSWVEAKVDAAVAAAAPKDTGRRVITSLFTTMTEGVATIRRSGALVALTIDVAKFSNTGTFTLAGVIPAGFRPSVTHNDIAVQLTGTDGWRVAIQSSGNLSIYGYTGGWVRGGFLFMTQDPFPTEPHPGTPA